MCFYISALPSADRWGRKRQAYYHTSYVDADFGGMNESDEELAELEREDATRRQKKLDAALQAVRFDDLVIICRSIDYCTYRTSTITLSSLPPPPPILSSIF